MRVINKNVWTYFEHYKDSDKLAGFDTASRRYYLEKISFSNRGYVYAVTTSSCTPTRVVDTIKVVEFGGLSDATNYFNNLKANSKALNSIEYASK